LTPRTPEPGSKVTVATDWYELTAPITSSKTKYFNESRASLSHPQYGATYELFHAGISLQGARSPLWVISGHVQRTRIRPFYPRKLTFVSSHLYAMLLL